MKTLTTLSQAELKRRLDYDPNTGIFTRKIGGFGFRCGQVAGSPDPIHRYTRIKINGVLYLAHRLAWLYVYGEWPKSEIDHIDRDRGNNRIFNLREATRSENQCNKPVYKNNRAGFKGVHWHKQHRKYAAVIHIQGKSKHLGLFSNPSAAAEAYRIAAHKLHGAFKSAA